MAQLLTFSILFREQLVHNVVEGGRFNLMEIDIVAELADSEKDSLVEFLYRIVSQIGRSLVVSLQLPVNCLVLLVELIVSEERMPVRLVERRVEQLVDVGDGDFALKFGVLFSDFLVSFLPISAQKCLLNLEWWRLATSRKWPVCFFLLLI